MSEKLLSDIATSHEEIVSRILLIQRRWLMAIGAIGGVSAFPALPYLFASPDYPFYDAVMQLLNGVILLLAVGALFVLPASQTRRIAFVAFSLVMADLIVRVILTHHMPSSTVSISREVVMMQFAPMIPAILVGSFLFLRATYAMVLCWTLTLITAASVLIYQVMSGPDAWSDFAKLGVVLQFVFAHPVIVLLLSMIGKIMRRYEKYANYAVARSGEIEGDLLRDETGQLLTRPAILQLLKEHLALRQFSGRVLVVKFKPGKGGNEQSFPETRRVLLNLLKQVLPESTSFGLLESNHLLAIVTGDSDYVAEETRIRQLWVEANRDILIELRSIQLAPGMTWAILLADLEIQ